MTSSSANSILLGAPQKRKTITTTINYAWRNEAWVPIIKTETEEEYDVDLPLAPALPPYQPPVVPYYPQYPGAPGPGLPHATWSWSVD